MHQQIKPRIHSHDSHCEKTEDDRVQDFYVSCYHWTKDSDEENFFVGRHGNATKLTASAYYRTDKATLQEARSQLMDNKSTSSIYRAINEEKKSTVGEELRNPRQLYNLKQSIDKKRDEALPKQVHRNDSEVGCLVMQMRQSDTEPFIRSVVSLPSYCVATAFTDRTIKNIERFCVNGTSVFRCDTTFEIIDNLWLTDTSYTNFSLINAEDSSHPEFPGPLMVHFAKDTDTYRCFAVELIVSNPSLLKIGKVGHDMDRALENGLGSVFVSSESCICLQHVSERDGLKLDQLNANKSDKKKVLTDIYGSQVKSILQFGLADAIDQTDFDVKLESLKPVWDELVLGFHQWFVNHRANSFKTQVIGKALDWLKLCKRFTNNRLEVMHRIQNKNVSDENLAAEATQILNSLHRWIVSFDKEAERALYGHGK